MKQFWLCLFFLCVHLSLRAQQDSLSLDIKLNDDKTSITVRQKIIYHNPYQHPISDVKLLNWVAAYQSRKTPLLKRKIEDRKKELYFAKKSELGELIDLQYSNANLSASLGDKNKEQIILPLPKPINPKESTTLDLVYTMRLPDSRFTGYGYSEKDILLKYFFLVPETYNNQSDNESYYRDTEETANAGSYWKINCDLPVGWHIYSNLPLTSATQLSGKSVNDPEILLSTNQYPSFLMDVDGEKINIELGYPLSEYQKQVIAFFAPTQLRFIKSKTNNLPTKLFISSKFKNKEGFIGTDDIKFWKFKYQLFTDQEKIDLDYFSILSKKIMDESLITNKTNDHWLKNGIKSYLEIQYLKSFFPNHRLLGNLPDHVNFFGIKPLKIFYASRLKLTERYGLAYHYIYTQNLDQKITTPYDKLSNFNTTAISQFEMGSLLNYLSEYAGTASFDLFLKNYLSQNYQRQTTGKAFLDQLYAFTDGQSWFLENMMNEKHRINFNLKNIRDKDFTFLVNLRKTNGQNIPIKLETETKTEQKTTFWQKANASKNGSASLPKNLVEKIVLNDEYIFPETNFRDNYLYTKGLFSNTKKLRLKLVKDIQNPEYNEIFLSPRLTFNAYDKILLGLNFKNQGIFDQKFNYSLTPYYSSGTGKLTGSAALGYSILPPDSFFRSWNFGLSGSYFHYDHNLAYKKFGASTSFNFNKDPRSAIGRSLYFAYNYYERDLTPLMILDQQYAKYNLWNVGYNYSDNQLIHEKYISTNLQWMEDFQKISAEAFYRWEYAKDKKISFRWFAGYFIKNNTKNNLFDYGISRVSNYSFSYGLLGQSDSSGILSQQFILAEGGFKSLFGTSANQFITSTNVDAHLWKWFNIYADAGVYKNKHAASKFIWDSGIKVKVIPDFLELYFPIDSSLGFEPSFKDYGYRIRYTLVLNLGALINNLRRGVF